MPSPWIIVGFLVAIIAASVVSYSHGYGVADTEWTAKTEEGKKEAAKQLAAETQKVLETERVNVELTAKLERERHEAGSKLDAAYAAARRAARNAGGLRDQGRGAGCPATVPAAPAATGGAPEGAPAGRALSAEAEQFLFEFAREADQLNLDFRECRAHALSARAPAE